MTEPITLTRPDDWPVHVRDGAAPHTVLPHGDGLNLESASRLHL
jgi:dihydroorotase